MNTYFKEAVAITSDYLGPAAERFLLRQLKFHSKLDPSELKKEDVKKMAQWVGTALSLLTNDKKMCMEVTARIEKIV